MNLYKKLSLVFLTLTVLILSPVLGYTYDSYFTFGLAAGLGYTATGADIDDKEDDKFNYGAYIDATYRFSELFSGGVELHYTHALTAKSTKPKDSWAGIGSIDYIGVLLFINLHLIDDWMKFTAGLGGVFGIGKNKGSEFALMLGAGTEIPVYKEVLYVPIMFRTDLLLAERTLYKMAILFGMRYKFK